MQLEGLDHVAFSVRDIPRSAQWYVEVLGLERQHEGMWDGIPVFVGKGNTGLALFPFRGNSNGERDNQAPRILHFALCSDRENFAAAQAELTRRGIPFEFQDHEISHSIYLRDPDGHQIEITTYEL